MPPRVRELLERWKDLDEQHRAAIEEWNRTFDANARAKQRLHELELQQRWCVLDILDALDMSL